MIAAIFTKEADIDAGVNFAISASLLLARAINPNPNAQQGYRVCLSCFEHGFTSLSEFLTTKEVANLLRLKQRKVYDLAARNMIPYVKATGNSCSEDRNQSMDPAQGASLAAPSPRPSVI